MKYLDQYNEYLSRLSPEVFEGGSEVSYLEWLEDQLGRGVGLLTSIQAQGIESTQDAHDVYILVSEMSAPDTSAPRPDDIPF